MVDIRILETPQDLEAVERLQRLIWPGNELEIVPVHIFRAAVHNGGLVIGAYQGTQLIGFVFGFPGVDFSTGETRLNSCLLIWRGSILNSGIADWVICSTRSMADGEKTGSLTYHLDL